MAAPQATRDQICILASGYGACIRRPFYPNKQSHIHRRRYQISTHRPEQFKVFELQMLREMEPDSLTHFRDSPDKAEWLENDLFWNACTSSQALRSRARLRQR